MQEALFRRLEQLQKEVLVEAAYFIPLKAGVERVKALVDRGVRVRIVTNSLASNDVIQAFAGYSISREALLEAGVELHELRFEPGPARKRQLPAGSKAGLHTKTMVFDRKDVFIGSFNLDARSATINTEAGLYIESPALAAQVIEYLDEGAGPEVSYRVQLDKNGAYLMASKLASRRHGGRRTTSCPASADEAARSRPRAPYFDDFLAAAARGVLASSAAIRPASASFSFSSAAMRLANGRRLK